MSANNNTKSIISACFAILSWSTVATAFKIALETLTHYELVLIAATTSLIIFAVLLTTERKWKILIHTPFRRWRYYALLGLLNPVAYYLILFKSYSLLPAQIAQPINYMWPILLTILLAVFAHRRIPGWKYVGLSISLVGLTCISVGSEDMGDMHFSPFCLLLPVASAVVWATYWMIRNKDRGDFTVALFLCFLFGTIYLYAAAPFVGVHALSEEGLLSGIYVGCFEMGIPFIAFGYAIRNTSNTALINQMCYLSPFLSMFFISIVLGEHIYATTIVGLMLIVMGIVFNEYGVRWIVKRTR